MAHRISFANDVSSFYRNADVRFGFACPSIYHNLAAAKQANATIQVNWAALSAAGVDPDQRISCSLRNASGDAILHAIFAAANIDQSKVDYTESDLGAIEIDDAYKLNATVYTRLYDIRDLIIEMQQFSTFAAKGKPAEESDVPARSETVDAIIKAVEDMAESDSWKDNGGTVGSIRELRNMLFISQSPRNHRAVQIVLDQLRKKYRS